VSDRVIVRVPASTSYVSIVRATASPLAATLGFSYDRITDLHIAIDEVCSRVLATSEPAAERLEVIFETEGDGLRVSVRGDADIRHGAVFLTDWSKAILTAVTERVDIGSADGPTGATFAVTKG
jgi:serine/threonine-protein kinase RsbW